MELDPTPIAGGVMIGIASVTLLATMGRIAGISGIIWGAVTASDRNWRFLFLTGLVAGGALVHTITGKPLPTPPDAPLWLAITAGLLVGIGTRMGSGCTSGHGICGIGRLSIRSMAATLAFMIAGVITVFFVRHLFGGLV